MIHSWRKPTAKNSWLTLRICRSTIQRYQGPSLILNHWLKATGANCPMYSPNGYLSIEKAKCKPSSTTHINSKWMIESSTISSQSYIWQMMMIYGNVSKFYSSNWKRSTPTTYMLLRLRNNIHRLIWKVWWTSYMTWKKSIIPTQTSDCLSIPKT